MKKKTVLFFQKIYQSNKFQHLGFLYFLRKKIIWISGEKKIVIQFDIRSIINAFWFKSCYRNQILFDNTKHNLFLFTGFLLSDFSKIKFYFKAFYLKILLTFFRTIEYYEIYANCFGIRYSFCNNLEIAPFLKSRYSIISRNPVKKNKSKFNKIFKRKKRNHLNNFCFSQRSLNLRSNFIFKNFFVRNPRKFELTIVVMYKQSSYKLEYFNSTVTEHCFAFAKGQINLQTYLLFLQNIKLYIIMDSKKNKNESIREIFFIISYKKLYFIILSKCAKEFFLFKSKLWIFFGERVEKRIKVIALNKEHVTSAIIRQIRNVNLEIQVSLKKKSCFLL